ncbi:MAG: hypothetical protein KKD56_05995 [Acidobacteria bacterium]|nr:hypothetical protein [Acidobacteriota bacterium]MBU1474749.1 hypothetical protein [Acidobacteriota bacterium]
MPIVHKLVLVIVLSIEGVMLGRLPKPPVPPVPGIKEIFASILATLVAGIGLAWLFLSHFPSTPEEMILSILIAMPFGYLAGDFVHSLDKKS